MLYDENQYFIIVNLYQKNSWNQFVVIPYYCSLLSFIALIKHNSEKRMRYLINNV